MAAPLVQNEYSPLWTRPQQEIHRDDPDDFAVEIDRPVHGVCA
jgi:hypothetical protein